MPKKKHVGATGVSPSPTRYQPLLAAWQPWISAVLLALWSAWYLYRFEMSVMKQAQNVDGGILLGESVFTLGYVFAACAAFTRSSWKRLHPLFAAASGLVPHFFIEGTRASSGDLFTLAAIPFYVAANVFCFTACMGEAPEGEDREESRGDALIIVLSLALGLAIAFGVLQLRAWALTGLKVPSDKNSLGMFYIPRVGGGATDIASSAFTAWGSLLWPALWMALAGAAVWIWNAKAAAEEKKMLWALWGAAVLGKLAIASLSFSGVGILPVKITSINTNYYALVTMLEEKGLFTWLRTYNDFQLAQGAHGDTHPPGPVLLYWLMTRLVGHSPWLIALGMASLTALTAPLLYRLARDHYQSPAAGLGAALLYISSPMSLILSSAGIDAVVALLLLLGLRCVQKSFMGGGWKEGLNAGLWFALGSYFSFGLPLALMFAGLWTLHSCFTRRESWASAGMAVLECWVPLLGGVAIGHLLGFGISGGHFSYWKSLGSAQFIHRSMNQYRTYELWSWANVALYAGYAGLATLAAYLIRAFSALWRGDGRDGFLVLSVPFVLTLIFSCMGRGEVQREFLYGILFLAVPAGRLISGKEGLRLAPALCLLALNTAGAAFLEMHVLDYW